MNARSTIEQAVSEDAPVTGHEDFYHQARLYHGTDRDELGRKILADGFVKPGNAGPTRVNKTMEPMGGRVYVTGDLRQAAIYALGGIMMGHKPWDRGKGHFGWLFALDSAKVADAVPDEDTLGEMAHDVLTHELSDHHHLKKLSPETLSRFKYACSSLLSPQQAERCRRYDDYAHLTVAGKKLATELNRRQPALLHAIARELKTGNLAVAETLPVVEAWRVDKRRSEEIKDDASNFFEVAERIK